PYECYYNLIENPKFPAYTVFPEIVDRGHSENHFTYDSFDELFETLASLCCLPERKLIFAYSSEPDTAMHGFGAGSPAAGKVIREINDRVAAFASEAGADALLVVTADHGQIDITRHIELYRDQELAGFLSRPLSLEGRAASIAIASGREKEFRDYFLAKYAGSKLYRAEELIASGVFGVGVKARGREFLGDYIVVPEDGAAFLLHGQASPYPGNHGGLLPGEIEVPLIIWAK
ncbi:MAG: alkaline phosphatase family protein, partial [Bacilli bacterium]